jgi:hypothetical protein
MAVNNTSIIADLVVRADDKPPGLSANEVLSEIRRGPASQVTLYFSVQRKNPWLGNVCLAVRKLSISLASQCRIATLEARG